MLWLLLSCLVCTPNPHPSNSSTGSQNVYDSRGNTRGSLVERPPSSTSSWIDIYNNRGERVGYGKTSPYDGSLQIYDKHWQRTFELKKR